MRALEVAQKQPSEVITDQQIITVYNKSPSTLVIGIVIGVAIIISLATLVVGLISGAWIHRYRYNNRLERSAESVTIYSSENSTEIEIHESDITVEDVSISATSSVS